VVRPIFFFGGGSGPPDPSVVAPLYTRNSGQEGFRKSNLTCRQVRLDVRRRWRGTELASHQPGSVSVTRAGRTLRDVTTSAPANRRDVPYGPGVRRVLNCTPGRGGHRRRAEASEMHRRPDTTRRVQWHLSRLMKYTCARFIERCPMFTLSKTTLKFDTEVRRSAVED